MIGSTVSHLSDKLVRFRTSIEVHAERSGTCLGKAGAMEYDDTIVFPSLTEETKSNGGNCDVTSERFACIYRFGDHVHHDRDWLPPFLSLGRGHFREDATREISIVLSLSFRALTAACALL
jgi:hypothetical protein